jgi:hypothetical protein
MNDATKKPHITVDSNLINTKKQIPAMNTLERWEKEGKIVLCGAERLAIEISKHPRQPDASKRVREMKGISEPCVIGQSYIGHSYITNGKPEDPQFCDIASIMFPQKKYDELSQNEANDVMHLISHYFAGADYFITNDRKDFIDGGKQDLLKKRFRLNVMTPDELVSHFVTKYDWEL